MSKWVKCSEWMPEPVVSVLVTDGFVVIIGVFDGFDWGDCYWSEFATHWAPLPEPPVLV